MLQFEINNILLSREQITNIKGIEFTNGMIRYNSYYFDYDTNQRYGGIVRIYSEEYSDSLRTIKASDTIALQKAKDEWKEYLYNFFLLSDAIKDIITD